MHYYKRNLGDYAKKAGRLSMLQHGAYTLLIDSCYDREQFPTLDDAIEWTWASTFDEVEAVKFVLSRFFVIENGLYVQKRIQEELAEYREKSETNKRIALERETKRAENRTKRDEALKSGDEPPPNHKPITNNHNPLLKSKALVAPKARPSKRCPDDFVVTQEMANWANEQGIDFQTFTRETETFKDHTFASAKVDWEATWRNWMRKLPSFKPAARPKQVLGLADQVMQNFKGQQGLLP